MQGVNERQNVAGVGADIGSWRSVAVAVAVADAANAVDADAAVADVTAGWFARVVVAGVVTAGV
jgi:hypothetical protein